MLNERFHPRVRFILDMPHRFRWHSFSNNLPLHTRGYFFHRIFSSSMAVGSIFGHHFLFLTRRADIVSSVMEAHTNVDM